MPFSAIGIIDALVTSIDYNVDENDFVLLRWL